MDPTTPDPLSEYDRLQEELRQAKALTAEAKAHYEIVLARETGITDVLTRLRSTLITKIVSPPIGKPDVEEGDPLDIIPAHLAVLPAPVGVRQSLWELLAAIPRDEDIAVADLRAKFAISEGALNTRIMKAKKAGFVQSSSWGRYELTAKGREIRNRRLTVVPNN